MKRRRNTANTGNFGPIHGAGTVCSGGKIFDFSQRRGATDRFSFLEKRAENNRRLRGIGEVQKEETK
jgi:hypothetical protein